ncbi:MAG: enoyl-CoA hydratase-related protein [Pseudomonadota bacterium]|nr:enoyl-CoA hydratase-related protein [Pseudomonadota bacterium]
MSTVANLVTREDRGRVSVLTLNNPPANGYSHAMHKALDAHVLDLRMDKGTDVIVLRGAGERFFCAGADIGYLQSLDPEDKYAFCLHANETLLRLENTPKLVIAALNGHCVGGGLEIALACDLRIGRASGSKPNLVGLPEVTLGVLPGTGGTQRLTRVLGRARALQWMVEGRNVSVEEAHAVGLVHEVLPEAGWWEAVLAYAATFTRPGRSSGAVGLIKRAVLGGADLPLEAGLALERELQMRLFTAADAKEGLAAFVEKRRAVFTGDAHGAGGTPATPPQSAAATTQPFAPTPAPGGVAGGRIDIPRPPEAPPRREAPRPLSAVGSVGAGAVGPGSAGPAAENGFGGWVGSGKTGGPSSPGLAGENGSGGWVSSGRTGATPGTELTPPERPRADDDRGHLDTPRVGGRNDGARADGSGPRTPEEFAGFEDFADFGPDETELGGEAFGTGGRPHGPEDPLPGRIDLHRTRIPDAVLNLLGRSIVERYLVLPVKRTETTLLVAMADPGDLEALDAIREETGLEVQAVRAPELDIAVMVARYYRA